ncbi:hypothetical protein BO71DRAFT_162300 [Aspergillus ellipticus CBS 707.79]|uniref:ATP-dependent DNA helicase n=1 Tax=Aspergillus ellipticus CBS 707.79 TaxID=1448320 RepID=A0A319CSX2_9EURO|nr:hypothetical protein BO71DRAFT_162300 [Aspergillus ellipticus CBS 707.79]
MNDDPPMHVARAPRPSPYRGHVPSRGAARIDQTRKSRARPSCHQRWRIRWVATSLSSQLDYMYLTKQRARAPGILRQFFSIGPVLNPQSASRYSTLRPPPVGEEAVMFKKAVKDHSVASATTLQSTLTRSNGSVPAKPPPPSLGVKRKIEMTAARESNLGSLHEEVYFDENDFDDDDDLDFEEPDPFIPPAPIVRPSVRKAEPAAEYPTLHNASPQDEEIPIVDLTETPKHTSTEIKYPDLPPVPDDNVPPSSSIQYPWSSSPPSHFQQPNKKPRTLPWLKDEPEPAPAPKQFETPARPKQTAPWNKTASSIKDEQREMRRQYKNQKAQANSHLQRSRPKVASIFLSDEQRHVLDAVVQQGKSIFFTGSAGTGKSVLMREIIKKLRDKYKKEPDRVAVTASTGLAACNIEGVTLHSFAGIGLGKEPVPELVKKVSI